MLNYKKVSFFIFGLFLTSTVAWGQAARSPFSYLGIGEPYGNALTHNQGMAGVGISNPQYFYLNNQNPALLVYNRFTVFEGGFIGERRTTKGNGLTETNGSGNLNYLITAFPVKLGKWTTSIGIMPYSSVNYKLDYIDSIEGTSANTVSVKESGEGGINQFFWSNGIALNQDISIGMKATYLAGSIIRQYSNTLTVTNEPFPYIPTVYIRNYVRDLNLSAGFSYHKDSIAGRKNYKINFGAVYDFKANLNSDYFARIERRNSTGIVDSTTIVGDVPGSITIPSTFSAGLSVGKGDRWLVGVDFVYRDYRNFTDFGGEVPPWGTEGWKLSLGSEFTPDVAAGSYLKRMTYRTGVTYDNYPYLINGNLVKDFGINFGLSMPVSRISSLDFAVKVGKRGNLEVNTIEESYVKIYFGMTFNDQWFIKRRFD